MTVWYVLWPYALCICVHVHISLCCSQVRRSGSTNWRVALPPATWRTFSSPFCKVCISLMPSTTWAFLHSVIVNRHSVIVDRHSVLVDRHSVSEVQCGLLSLFEVNCICSCYSIFGSVIFDDAVLKSIAFSIYSSLDIADEGGRVLARNFVLSNFYFDWYSLCSVVLLTAVSDSVKFLIDSGDKFLAIAEAGKFASCLLKLNALLVLEMELVLFESCLCLLDNLQIVGVLPNANFVLRAMLLFCCVLNSLLRVIK